MSDADVVVIGGGFCGLAAAHELVKRGVRVTVLERDAEVGGLAGSFEVNGTRLEKFYHHWFTNDAHVMQLIADLGKQDQILQRPTRTGMYFANNFFKLSTPFDLLRFTPLSLPDRIRLGLLALKARRVNDWRQLENLTASEWLRDIGGERVYRVVWEPLLRGKFGDVAEEVSAVWFWNKLKLRGGSRGKGGAEHLAYYKGGFAALADAMVEAIRASGGEVLTNVPVIGVQVKSGRATGVVTKDGVHSARAVIATPPLPIVADLLEPHVSGAYRDQLRRIRYLGNVCLVLELDRSLSSTYWLNVNDPGFPFVGVIEHTNFEPEFDLWRSAYHLSIKILARVGPTLQDGRRETGEIFPCESEENVSVAGRRLGSESARLAGALFAADCRARLFEAYPADRDTPQFLVLGVYGPGLP